MAVPNRFLKDVFVDALDQLAEHIEATEQGERPATGYRPLSQLLDGLQLEQRLEQPPVSHAEFADFLSGYLSHSVQLHHPFHAAHQVAIPDTASALASLVNGFMNNPMAIYEMGPVGAAIEFVVINWMLKHIGWAQQPRRPEVGLEHGAGVLTHGGSLANLTGLLAARARVAPEAWEQGVPNDLAVLVSPVAHYSVARAVAILGLGERAIVHLPCDELGRVDAHAMEQTIEKTRACGRRVMAVIANACATATGLHDPLRPMGEICRSNDVFFHVDACHGASALLHSDTAHHLDGIELADVVIWDAHKMLQVSALCAAVLFRDHRSFDVAFSQKASYLAYGRDAESYDSLPRAVECTKSAMGVKVYFNLLLRGEHALGQFVADRYAMGKTAYDCIVARDRFSCPYVPETNIICFRIEGDDQLQQSVRDQLVAERTAHLTTAEVGGTTYLRMTLMNPLTDVEAINTILDMVEQKADSLLTSTQTSPRLAS
ncbi:MAG: pyridoxal-dependent decarboxylase [Pseudomonadota bacterium]